MALEWSDGMAFLLVLLSVLLTYSIPSKNQEIYIQYPQILLSAGNYPASCLIPLDLIAVWNGWISPLTPTVIKVYPHSTANTGIRKWNGRTKNPRPVV